VLRTLLSILCLLCASAADQSGDEFQAACRDRITEYQTVISEISVKVAARPAQGLPEELQNAIDAWT
jgi:hypothetical protein